MISVNFGISFLPDLDERTRPAAEYFEDALTLARIADDAGLQIVKMTEHYLHRYGGYCPSPLAFLAAVAATTSRIRLRTGCVLPAFHHPVQLAAEAAMVDAISRGRLEVGFARAYLPHEFEAFDVPLDESRRRFEATIEAVIRLWTEERVSMETPFFSLADASGLPRPTQRPHPPVWGAATVSRQSFAWLGERGYGLLVTSTLSSTEHLRELIEIYREAFHDNDASSGRSRVALSIPLYLAPRSEDAVRQGDLHLREYLDVWELACRTWESHSSRDYASYGQLPRAIRAATPELVREAGGALFGSPSQAVEQTARLREDLGIDEILWQLDFGGMPMGEARRTLDLFIAEVLPALPAAPQTVGTDQATP